MSAERARELDKAAEEIYQRMLADHMLTTAIRAHRQAKRSTVPCAACGTKCRSHSTVLPSLAATSSASRASTPSSSTTSSHTLQTNGNGHSSQSLAPPNANGSNGSRTPTSSVGGSTGIGSGSGRADGAGNVFFDCLNCGRATASNRYANHLSSCLNIGGSRRTASRAAAAKVTRLGTNDRSSPSPYMHSEAGNDSDGGGSVNGVNGTRKRKGRPPGSGNKRAASPAKPPVVKKAKVAAATAAPASRANLPYAPSRLRDSPATAGSDPSTPSPTKSAKSLPNGYGSAQKPTIPLPGSGLAMGGWGLGIGGDLAIVDAEPADPTVVAGSDSSDGGADDY